MATPVFQTVTSGNGASGSSSTSIGVPTGTTNGDLMFLVVTVRGDVNITTPTGYTKLDENRTGTTVNDVLQALYYKVAASEATITVAFSGSTEWVIARLRITGQGSSAIGVYSKNSGTTQLNTFSSITTTAGNNLILAIEGNRSTTSTTWSPAAGWTSILQDGNTSTGHAVDRQNQTSAGTISSFTNSWAGEVAGNPWVTWIVTIASLNAYSMPATKAGYSTTTITAGTRYGRVVTATVSARSVSTVAAGTRYGRILPAAQRAYTTAVFGSTPTRGFIANASQQVYSLSYKPASTRYGSYLGAAQRAYSVSGTSVQLQKGNTLNVGTLGFSVSGNAASISSSTTSKPGSGRSRAATMALFQQLHDKTQKELRDQLALNDELIVLGDTPKKKKVKKRKKDDLEELNSDIADLDKELASLQNIIDIPPLPVERLDAIAFPQQVGYTDQNIDDDADDEEVITHYLLNHPF